MAGKHNIVAKQGITFKLNFKIETNGVGWDLSAATAVMAVKQSYTSTTKLLNLSVGSGITMDSAGNVAVLVADTVMATLPAGRWVYDFQVNTGSETIDLLEGRFIINREVSN